MFTQLVILIITASCLFLAHYTVTHQVVPVLERDIYRPHEIEHTKRVVNIHHEAPEIIGTKVAKPISVSEWESQSGGYSLRSATATTSSGLTGRRERSGSSSSSSSDEERYETVDGVRRKKGLGEKLMEKVGLDKKDGHGDPKDAAFNNNQSGTTGYGQSSSTTGTSSSYGSSTSGTQYGADGQRKKGLAEKAKETVGLDPKDGRDPKDIGYNQSSSTTGYNQGSSSSYGTTSGVGSTSEYGADGQRKKGLAEKAKETVGLDPKDGRDPKDIGYNNNNQSTTGYNQSSSTTGTGLGGVGSSGVGSSSSSGVNSTSTGTGYDADSQRKKGFGEKVKEAVGLDPKDPAKDPKDQGYVGGQAQPGQGVASEYAQGR
jgi:hypothetical protein